MIKSTPSFPLTLLSVLLAPLLSMAESPSLVGLWKFDDAGNLGKATVGADLLVTGTAPVYSAALTDGTSQSLNGVITTNQGSANYLTATHGIGANGGGTKTNQYSLVYDVKRPTGNLWRTFFQTNLSNSDDAEYFTRGGGGVVNSLGVSEINYSGSSMPENEWMRLVISVDLGNYYKVYKDGVLFFTHATPSVDGRFAFDVSKVLLFADNNGENHPLSVGAVAIYDRGLSALEVEAIGEAGASIPTHPFGDSVYLKLDIASEVIQLAWSDYDVSGLTNPSIKVSRNGTVIVDLSVDWHDYTDTPPAPGEDDLIYNYQVELYDGTQVVAGSTRQGSLTWHAQRTGDGLLANYQFEKGFQDTASALNIHDAQPVNGSQIIGGGVYGHCVTLNDQLQQGVSVADHADLNFGDSTDFTISLWLRRWGAVYSSVPNGEASDGVLICKQNWTSGSNPGWGIYATSDGGVKWNLAGSSRKTDTLAGSSMADGRWHHILVSNTRSGTARCFVDGKFVKSISIAGAGSVNNTLPLSMGVDGNGQYSWKGSLDEVALWNRALTDNEALDVYRSSKKGMALSGKAIIDSDNDKMDDAWERSQFGDLTQTGEGDFDNDGKSNFMEYSDGGDPKNPVRSVASRVTQEVVGGQTYPVLHYYRPQLEGDVSYLPEASPDLTQWKSGGGRFIPYGNPTDLGNGQREYHVRYFQSVDAVAAGRVMFRVRMESRYQAAIGEDIQPSVELRNGQAIITWTTSDPSVSVVTYQIDNNQTAVRYENFTMTTYHEVVVDVEPGESFTYTVIQTDELGVETRSNTFTVPGMWDYSPPPVPDQFGFNSGGDWSARADEILTLPGVLDRGYCLDYQCGDGRLAYELARKSQIVVIGVEDTQAEVDVARAFLTARGVYGSRVTVILASDLANLPFSHDIFNLIVSQNQMATSGDYAVLKAAVESYAIPDRGVVVGRVGGSMHADPVKPANAGSGTWSMAYGNPGNTSASTEAFNGKTNMSDFELRWLGAPGAELSWDRQTAEQPPLAMNGRFYCQGRGRILALDSHNGSVLWTKELDDAQRFNLLRDAGDLTADDDAVWLSLKKECWRMAGDTGHLTVYPLVPGPRSDLEYSWNYICRIDDHLLGSASVDAAFYKEHWGGGFWYVHETSQVADQVVSDNLFSLNPDNGSSNWTYSDGLILSVSICAGNGKVFFLETRNPTAMASSNRRLTENAWKQNLHLVCLELATGNKLWDQAISPSGGSITAFLMYDSVADKLVLSTTSDQNYLYAYNPTDGSLIWNHSHAFHKTDHGGKSQHPVIKDAEVYMEPHVYDIATGVIKRSNLPSRRGQSCSTFFGAKNVLFYRTGYSGEGLSMWPIAGGATTGIDHVRGSCWLNYAPANGMLLVQEMSAGCSCATWIHISQGWGGKN